MTEALNMIADYSIYSCGIHSLDNLNLMHNHMCKDAICAFVYSEITDCNLKEYITINSLFVETSCLDK